VFHEIVQGLQGWNKHIERMCFFHESMRAVDCIRNGILLAGGGSFLANLPLPLVITALKSLEEPTGCGGIVNRGSIGNVGDLQGIISLLT
jgi:hypothetical protein